MSRTVKTEWSSPDSWAVGCRLRRRARPAGRLHRLIAEELAVVEDGPGPIVFEPVEDEPEEGCSCSCRRCALHGDCGGCLVGHIGWAQL